MNKRGQVYIVFGIIVCMLAFVLVSKPNFIREQVLLQNFEGISSNYLTESPKVVNDVLSGTPQDTPEENIQAIENKLSTFTGDFKDYAKNQDPNIGLIYIYSDENGVVIENQLSGENVYFVKQSGESNVILNNEEPVEGNLVFVGTGTGTIIETNLCENYNNEMKNYCILQTGKLTPGEYTLKIGDVNYKFEISAESPELIVILKSKSEDGNTIKVDVSESKL